MNRTSMEQNQDGNGDPAEHLDDDELSPEEQAARKRRLGLIGVPLGTVGGLTGHLASSGTGAATALQHGPATGLAHHATNALSHAPAEAAAVVAAAPPPSPPPPSGPPAPAVAAGAGVAVAAAAVVAALTLGGEPDPEPEPVLAPTTTVAAPAPPVAPLPQDLSTTSAEAVGGALLPEPNVEGLLVVAVNGDADTLGTAIVLDSGAVLTVQADGSVQYDPLPGFAALAEGESVTETFSYTITDGSGWAEERTQTINVNGSNKPPIFTEPEVATSLTAGTNTTINIIATDPEAKLAALADAAGEAEEDPAADTADPADPEAAADPEDPAEQETPDAEAAATDTEMSDETTAEPIVLAAPPLALQEPAPSFVSLTDNGDGTATLSIAPTTADVGAHEIVVVATDPTSPTQSSTATVSVTVVAATVERVTDRLVSIYNFDDGASDVVADSSGTDAPANLTIADPSAVRWVDGGGLVVERPTVISSSGSAFAMSDAIFKSNEMTVEAWVTPANTTQIGPARVVSLSSGVSLRNVTLGQGDTDASSGNRWSARVRSTETSNNGVPTLMASEPSVEPDRLTHLVMTRTTEGAVTLYVDGAVAATGTIGGDLSNWDNTFPLVLANETSLDRPWLGTFHLVAVYSKALSSAEVTQNHTVGS